MTLLSAFSLRAGDIVLTTLADFTPVNKSRAGAVPHTGLVEASDGYLYGTTADGGAFNAGTIFRVSLAGAVETVFHFDRTNGAAPYGTLIEGPDGTLFGTAFGMTSDDSHVDGSAFSFSKSGELTTLCWFSGTNGNGPRAGLTRGSDGNFYGTTTREGLFDLGTVFQLTREGILNTLAHFDGTNGASPYDDATLVEGHDGRFYGTTPRGGTGSNESMEYGGSIGTVFAITTNGLLTTLVSFTNSNGADPLSGLSPLDDGIFLGTTFLGDNFYGTIFKISLEGELTTLHRFGGNVDGAFPYPALIQANDGHFYGTTDRGGEYDRGTVFRFSLDRTVTTVFSFSGTNGWMPNRLLQARDGNFYGTTFRGGSAYRQDSSADDLGTVFRLHVPLQPLLLSVTRTNGRVALRWSSVAGEKYRVFYKRNAQDKLWKKLRDVPASSGITSLTFRMRNEEAIFRVELVLPRLSARETRRKNIEQLRQELEHELWPLWQHLTY